MGLLLHESHPMLVHLPLTLLPAAAGADLVAALRGEPGMARAGRELWVAAMLSGLAAGLTGLASSQEVTTEEKSARDMMFLHGMGNLTLVLGTGAMALWRLRRGPTRRSAGLGLLATLAVGYTAYLGGEMVYSHEVGVKRSARAVHSPPLLSRQAPGRLLVDALRGVRWLLSSLGRTVSGREHLAHEALIGDGASARMQAPSDLV